MTAKWLGVMREGKIYILQSRGMTAAAELWGKSLRVHTILSIDLSEP